MEEKPLRYGLSLRIYREEKCFGTGVAQLLELVERLHSLRAATMQMNMAYSKAWSVIKTAEKELGFKLLNATTGGRNGGGATLTPEAQAVLQDYRAFQKDVAAAADELFVKHFGKYR